MAGEHDNTTLPVVPPAAGVPDSAPAPAAPPPSFSQQITDQASALGVDLSTFGDLAPETLSRVLGTIEKSAGSIALRMVGGATQNPAPAAQPATPAAPPATQAPAQPRMVPAVHDLKIDLPDPEKMGDEYGPEVKQLARAMRTVVDDYQRQIGAINGTLPRALEALDQVYNAHVTQTFDEDLTAVISEVPSLASIYGTGPTRRIADSNSPEYKARVALHEARQRFANAGVSPSAAMRMLAQAVGEQVTGTPSKTRNERGQFVPTQTAPPTHGVRTAPADQNPAAKAAKPRTEVVSELADELARKWNGR